MRRHSRAHTKSHRRRCVSCHSCVSRQIFGHLCAQISGRIPRYIQVSRHRISRHRISCHRISCLVSRQISRRISYQISRCICHALAEADADGSADAASSGYARIEEPPSSPAAANPCACAAINRTPPEVAIAAPNSAAPNCALPQSCSGSSAAMSL